MITVSSPGEKDVGIFGYEITIEGFEPDFSTTDREETRKEWAEFFEHQTGQRPHIIFEDELDELTEKQS